MAYDPRQTQAALDAQERLQRSQRRLTPGSLGGRSEQAQPKPNVPPPTPYRPTPEEQTWYLQGDLSDFVDVQSGVYTPRRRNKLIHIISELVLGGSSDTVIDVLRDGNHVVNLTIPAGTTHLTTVIDATFAINAQDLSFRILTAGTGAEQLTLTAVFV